METENLKLREVSENDGERVARERMEKTPIKTMAGTSSPPRGGTLSLPSTPSAEVGGVSPEREETKRPSPMPAGGSKPAGKLDNLSREELVRHIKKQALMLQKVKARSDELSAKLKAQELLNQEQPPLEKVAMEEFQVMKAERDQALMELKSVRQIIVSEGEQHRAEVTELKKKVTDLEVESKSLKEDIATTEAEQRSLRHQLSSQGDLYSALEKEMKAREATVTELQRQLEELLEERTKLQVTKDAIVKGKEEELSRKEEALADLTGERNGLRVHLSQLQQEVASMTENLELSASKLEGYEDQVNQLQEQVKELQSDCAKRDDENALLQQSNLQLNDKCNNISRQLDEQREREAMQQESKENTERQLGDEVASLRQQLSELQEREATKKTDRELELNEQVEKLTAANQQIQATLDRQTSSHREETKKLKAFALKLKKELEEVKEKEKVLREQVDQSEKMENAAGAGKLLEVYADLEKVRVERDQLLGRVEETTEQNRQQMESTRQQLKEEQDSRKSLQDQVESLSSQLHTAHQETVGITASLTLEKNQLTESLARTAERQGILESELSSLQTELSTALSQAETSKKATDSSVEEATALREALAKEKQLHRETQQRLTAAEKDAKAANVIDLELADYQRSVESLRSQLADKDLLMQENEMVMVTIKEKVEQQAKELESLKQTDIQKEETLGKFKTLLVKSKKELTDTRNQLAEMQQAAESLQEELEAQRQEGKETRAEMEALSAQLLAQEKEHELSLTQQQSLNCSLDFRVKSLQDELARMEMALHLAQQEHESYKVRVHSVLRQKTTGPSVTEVERSLRQDHEAEVIKLKAELKASQERLSGVLADQEALSTEHEQLVTRHEQLLLSSQQEHGHLQDQLLESECRFQMQTRVLEELVSQLRQDITQNTTAFKEQIQTLQRDHSQEIDRLKRELESTHAQMSRLQQEADAQVLARGPTQPQEDGTARSKNLKEWPSINGRSLHAPIEERSSGEGMDHSEIEPASLALSQKLVREDSASSLERLLSFSDTASTTTPVVDRASKELSSAQQEQLYSAAKRAGHLTELLHESEANCVRLAEQAKLLKEEIRRLERNQERHKEASNMEYLKNVILKFLHSPVAEQTNLIPVISQLLRLSVQEKLYLQETVKGNKVELPDASGESVNREGRTKGWGSYMHRWTGY